MENKEKVDEIETKIEDLIIVVAEYTDENLADNGPIEQEIHNFYHQLKSVYGNLKIQRIIQEKK